MPGRACSDRSANPMVVIEAALVILLADFVSGAVHWAEDTFGGESTPVVGRWIVKPNVLHHRDGGAFVTNSWLASSWDLLVIGLLVLTAAWWLGLLTWHVWLFVGIGVNANQIHKWSHAPRSRVPKLVRVLQKVGILQSPAHHAGHHRGDKNIRYCVVTDFLNPILDSLGWWRTLERLVPLWATPRRQDMRVTRAVPAKGA